MDERRKDKRVVITSEARIADEFSNLWSPYAWSPMILSDMSKGGIGFRSTEKLRAGSRYYFRMQLPDGGNAVKFSGNVVYQSEPTSDGHFHVGISIAKIMPVYAERIEKFIDTLTQVTH